LHNQNFVDDDVIFRYSDWCNKRGKKREPRDILKIELEKLNYKVARGKGVDVNNQSAKGYNITLITDAELEAFTC
jgi:hypothetical protein